MEPIKKQTDRCLSGKQTGSSSLGLAMLMGVVGAAGLYMSNQQSQTNQVVNEARRTVNTNEAKQINLSNFALARSLLSYRQVGSGTNMTFQSALYPDNYFSEQAWYLRANGNFSSSDGTWTLDQSRQELRINTPIARNLTAENLNHTLSTNNNTISSSLMRNTGVEKARSVLSFGQVTFSDNNPYLAASIEVTSTTELRDRNNNVITATDRARLPLDIPMPRSSRLEIRGPGNTFDSNSPNGTGSRSDRPFSPGDITFSLFGNGIIATARIMYAEGNLSSVTECAIYHCRNVQFDQYNNPQFWANRTHNILASNQLIGRSTHSFQRLYSQIARNDHGHNNADGSSCSVETAHPNQPQNNNNWWRSFSVTNESRQFTLFGEICGPGGVDNQQECQYVRTNFWIENEPFDNISQQEVMNICSGPGEGPECVAGDGGNDYFLPTYNRGRNSNGQYPLTFSAHHWDHWTDKMGTKDLKICIDGNDALRGVGQNCSSHISNTSNSCWQEHFHPDWNDIDIFYINPVSCEADFLFKRTACGCFSENTEILMGDGKSLKYIQDIKQGDSVWNPLTKRAVAVKKMVLGPEKLPMVHLKTDLGLIEITGNHPFPTADGIKPAFEIKVGDVLYDQNQTPQKVLSIDFVHSKEPPMVWNLELAGSGRDEDHYLVANGVVTGDLRIQQQLESNTRRIATVDTGAYND